MLKKNVALMLILMFILSPASVFAAETFSLELSEREVNRGEEIAISGNVPGETADVVVKIVTPRQTVLYIDVITASAGRYATAVGIPVDEDLVPSGRYTVTAGSGADMKTMTFTVDRAPVSPPGGGDTGGSGPGSGSSNSGGGMTTPPIQTGSIPSNAGSAVGSTIHPDATTDGQYIVGQDTITEAASQTKDYITIELPSSAGESGAPLELPAGSIHALFQQNLDLVISSGNRTVSFPAGSFAVPNDQQIVLRIVLKTVYSEEARGHVQRSLGAKIDYAMTDVVLSVEIQTISGNNVTQIHHLNKPAIVSFKLTDEQKKKISSELAGVYYADGQNIEYVPGTLKNGSFIFTTDHFSYYAVLEYNKVFIDLVGHWAELSVKALAAKQLVSGVDERHYEPNRGISRAEFVTLIMRSLHHEGKGTDAKVANPFKDVLSNRYYTDHVAQAASLGIMTGFEGEFRPNDPITREEAVVALVRTAEYFNLTKTNKEIPLFSDEKSISTWAKKTVSGAWSLGLIQGDGTRFKPKHSVTRAEVAVMVYRLITDRS